MLENNMQSNQTVPNLNIPNLVRQRWPIIERETYESVYALHKLHFYNDRIGFVIKTEIVV